MKDSIWTDERQKLYRIWYGMRRRCRDERHDSYSYYGGRGIKVCQRWDESFDAFQEDMGASPPGTSLDRIDVDGDYGPENCRWASNRTQRLNQRNVKLYELGGASKPLSDWAKESGIHIATLYNRVKRGVPLGVAIVPVTAEQSKRSVAGNAARWNSGAIREASK